MKTIKVAAGKIIISGNTITSTGIKEPCPNCGAEDCDNDCEPQQNETNPDQVAENIKRRMANAAINGIESFLLALDQSGVDVTSKQAKEALETSLDGIGNEYE